MWFVTTIESRPHCDYPSTRTGVRHFHTIAAADKYRKKVWEQYLSKHDECHVHCRRREKFCGKWHNQCCWECGGDGKSFGEWRKGQSYNAIDHALHLIVYEYACMDQPPFQVFMKECEPCEESDSDGSQEEGSDE